MKKFLLFCILFALTLFTASYFTFDYLLKREGPLETAKIVFIEPGTSMPRIAGLLEREGVVSHAALFNLMARLHSEAHNLQAGEYTFEPGASLKDVIDRLAKGDVHQRTVTFPEGWTTTEMLLRLQQTDGLTGPIPENIHEGTLLPETYAFTRGTPRSDLIARMQNAMQRVVAEEWEKRDRTVPLETPQELLTLASIIEKETSIFDEYPVVAGVFVNRLNKGIRLQSDPTVIYGATNYKGDITYRHLKEKHAYNTYIHHGLPPGPISNPGKRAIEAAANPAVVDYLFFVADGNGGHVFSRTLAEHNLNVKNWLKKQQGN